MSIEVGADSAWPLERPMRDRYLLIATTDYVDFSAFERGRAPATNQPLPGRVPVTTLSTGGA